MVRLFVLGFLYLNITASLIVYSAVDIAPQTDEDAGGVIVHKTPTRFSAGEIFVTPHAFPQFKNLFQNECFWTSKNTPLSSKAFYISYPKLDLKYIDNTLLDKLFENILSNKFVRNDVTRLSNQLLKIYGLKSQSGLSMSFNLIYPYDKTILQEALCSFLRIIITPDPNRTKGYEWKAQTFVRVFSQLCTSLNVGEKDTELNLRMRQMLAMSLGLSPLSYKEWFQEQYPALAKCINTCARNKSKKPLEATFTILLMHALIPKMYAPISQQIAMQNTHQDYFVMPPLPVQKRERTLTQEAQTPTKFPSSMVSPTPHKTGSLKQKSSARRILATLSNEAKKKHPSPSGSADTDYGPYFSGKGTFS